MPDLTFAYYGAAAVAAVAVSLTNGRRHLSFRLSVMLLGMWAVSNLADPLVEPWLDAAGFYACCLPMLDRPRRWLGVMLLLFLGMLITHALASVGLVDKWTRQVVLNGLFALQLIAVASPGGLNVARRFRDWCVIGSGARPVPTGAAALEPQEGEG